MWLQDDVISSRCDTKPYGKTISEVKAAMLCGSDGYKCPPDEGIVGGLRSVDCTNIHQMYGIAACFIPQEVARWSNLVWFVLRDPGPGIADLIRSFLTNASCNCAPGTYVCVGIITHEDYMHQYHLEHILGDNLNSCTLGQYEFLGVDDVLINNLLSYGYKHVPCDIEGCHVTLVFRLKFLFNNSYFKWCTVIRQWE